MAIAVLYPMLAQVVLTLVILVVLAVERRSVIVNREVRVADIALDSSRWPERSRKFANCYGNQFELPVLFYVLCLTAHLTRTADLIFVILAWLFVLSRVVHAYIHTTSNVVIRRGAAFGVGILLVIVMTAFLLFRLLLPPAV